MTDVESTCAKCNQPAKSGCSGCKTIRYCSKECQVEDWKSHKKTCPAAKSSSSKPSSSKPKANNATSSQAPIQPLPRDMETAFPNGAIWSAQHNKMMPLAFQTTFFTNQTDPSTPDPVYQELIDGFRFARSKTVGTKRTWSMEDSLKQFTIYLEKTKKSGMLPPWWSEEQYRHDTGLMRMAKEDEVFRVDKAYDWDEYSARSGGGPKALSEMMLGMMGERAYWEP